MDTSDYGRGVRRRFRPLRRGERATRGYSRLAASRRGFACACGPRASSISIRRASTTERWRTALRPIAPKRVSRCTIRPSRAATEKPEPEEARDKAGVEDFRGARTEKLSTLL